MSKAKSFQIILQQQIDPSEATWTYNIPSLPSAQQTNAEGLIKCISIVSSATRQAITLRYQAPPANRVTRGEVLDRFVLISFTDFGLRWPAVSKDEAPRRATGKENGDYITRLLTGGVTINGVIYNFFGHSNSQLKSRSCFLYAASKQDIAAKIEAMGDLSKLKSVGKKAKRIGLLFSSAEVSLMLPPERCEDIDDIAAKDYIFTDGCGLISVQLARQLAQRRNIMFRDRRYLPSVFQIRYRGYKGVLTLDPTLKGQVQVQFRASMRKFKDAPDHSFAVVEYSKPYAFGSLNDEVVVLLHALGISQDMLLAKQAEHLRFLANVSQGDFRAAFQFLSHKDRTDLAEKLLLEGSEAVQAKLKSMVKEEYVRMINKRDEQRCRILILKSRLLFGVCDPSAKDGRPGRLKEGECFVRVTQESDGVARTIIGTEVLVTRNPCLHPGDLQKFKAVDVPEFTHLVDCIVFSTRGKRPSADLMSGGDLDGDKFFVTWDPDIIPKTIAEPALYPGGKELITFGEVTGDSRAEYFARYTNASLGKVKNLYMKWARLGNAMSPECQQLNRLFSQCVDGNHIRIPPNLISRLEDPPEPGAKVASFILDVLHEACKEQIQSTANIVPEVDDHPDLLDLLLIRDKLAMSEFEILKIVLQYCDRHNIDPLEYSSEINFSALTDEEQIWLLAQLPQHAATSALVRNGLLQSQLVYPSEFHRFGLDHPRLHWKPVFTSVRDRMGRFLPAACQALESFHKKLILLNVNERLTVAVYVPEKIARASEVLVDSRVRVFVFPHSQGPQSPNYRVMPTKVEYRLYCDEHVFQLYQRRRGNTWIFLRAPKGDDSAYRSKKSEGDRRRIREATVRKGVNEECKVSIALDKINRDVQTHVGKVQSEGVAGAEIYVISNRDVASMNVLDQWLHFVDTEEMLPLFEKIEVEYTIPKLSNSTIEWHLLPETTQKVCRDRNLSHLRNIRSIAELREIVDLLWDHDEKLLLRDVVLEILGLETASTLPIHGQTVASFLLKSLPGAIYLTSTFFQSQSWENHKPKLEDDLIRLAPILLKEVVLAFHDLAGFIQQSLLILLRELKQISLRNFAELVELVGLTVRSAETGLDLLMGIFDLECPRLLVGRPAAIRQFSASLYGIALDHVEEAAECRTVKEESIMLTRENTQEGYTVVKSVFRIDSSLGSALKAGDHVRLTAADQPKNDPLGKLCSMDALVLKSETGSASFKCLHRPPPYVHECAWNITNCGSFVTSKASFDAVTALYTDQEACSEIYGEILGLPGQSSHLDIELPAERDSTLNESQNAALFAAMNSPFTLIWGPPGTGKTHTIVVILNQLLRALPKSRILVTAPTHNAVDNILRRFAKGKAADVDPVRVATQLGKVAQDLRSFTCDAMLGKDISDNFPARRKAQDRIKKACLIFTTCAGASLGLLRSERFDVVLVDEASQQTEPATLVPLAKGCSRAILVGDHVQLRATVQKSAVLTGYDVSLFERHYNMAPCAGIAKAMLDTQYRMHRSICDFSSTEFYEKKLKTEVPDDSRPLPLSQFPWPEKNRLVWLECSSPEDLGRQSKGNQGQVELCKKVIRLLTTPSSIPSKSVDPLGPSVVMLTPYTRQREALATAISNVEVSSIDGFQGREAEVVLFVTVRCNVSYDIGFLADMRRLNVVMTRAKCGVIIIGHKNTLTGGVADGNDLDESKKVWKRLIERCVVVDVEGASLDATNAGARNVN